MKNISRKEWPEIVFSSSESKYSEAIRRGVKAGKLKKLAPRLYTSNLEDPPEQIVSRHLYQILGRLFPGGILSHRSALEGGPAKSGYIVMTYKYTKKVTLPGITVRLLKGPSPKDGDTPFMTHLFISSRARAVMENLQSARGPLIKALSRELVEQHLVQLCNIQGVDVLNQLRDSARALAVPLQMQREFKILNAIIGAILSTHQSGVLMSSEAKAHAKGLPYDMQRLELFATLSQALRLAIFPVVTDRHDSSSHRQNLAFFEAYFSNYIEGTEFEVEEAADIIFHQKIMPDRPLDAHDILGTFQLVSNTPLMQSQPTSPTELENMLKERHYTLMSARTDKRPGLFKARSNRAGNTHFVKPALVRGTLEKAFSLYETLPSGLPKAMFMMFMIAEIHPFDDGNGRLARVMMNAECVSAGQMRLIIPTVFREDYLLALRKLSRSNEADAYMKMLARAQAFTASVDFNDYTTALLQLTRANAFLEPSEGQLRF